MQYLYLKICLVLTNFAILLFLVVLTASHYFASNNMKSWSFVFYILCFGWLLLRGIFWLWTLISTDKWGAFEFYVLYWVPVPMEFGSFMLVPLFFVHLLNQNLWRAYGMYVRPVYMFFTSGLTVFTIIWALLSAIEEREQQQCVGNADDDITLAECFHTEYSGWVFRILAAVCFLFLSVIQAFYGVKLYYLTDWQRLGLLGSKKEMMIGVNVFLFFSFASRVLYQVLVGLKLFIMPDIPLQNDADVSMLLFLITQFWDYAPTILLLATIVRGPATGKSSVNASRTRAESNLDDDDATLMPSVVDHHFARYPIKGVPLGKITNGQHGNNRSVYGEGRPPRNYRTMHTQQPIPQPAPPDRGDSANGSWWNGIKNMFSFGQSDDSEHSLPAVAYSADEKTRLVVSSNRRDQGGYAMDGHRFQSPYVPPPNVASWSSSADRGPVHNVMDDPQQRYWRPGSSNVDRDMFANSSLTSYNRHHDSPVTGDAKTMPGDTKFLPTPLDLSLQRDVSANATKWSHYAPIFPSASGSPAVHAAGSPSTIRGGPMNGALGNALKAAEHRPRDSSFGSTSGLPPVPPMSSRASYVTASIASSPTSSVTSWNDRGSGTSSRLSSRWRDPLNPAAQQLQWYYQQTQSPTSRQSSDSLVNAGKVAGSYRDFTERTAHLRREDHAILSPSREADSESMYYEDTI